MLQKLDKDFNTFENVMKQAAVIPCDLKPVEGEEKKCTRLKVLEIQTFRAVAILSKMVSGAILNFTTFLVYSGFYLNYGIA